METKKIITSNLQRRGGEVPGGKNSPEKPLGPQGAEKKRCLIKTPEKGRIPAQKSEAVGSALLRTRKENVENIATPV